MESKKEQKWEGIKSLFGADNYALVDSVTLCFHCIKLLIYIIFSVMSTMRNKCILVIDIANCYSTNFNITLIVTFQNIVQDLVRILIYLNMYLTQIMYVKKYTVITLFSDKKITYNFMIFQLFLHLKILPMTAQKISKNQLLNFHMA